MKSYKPLAAWMQFWQQRQERERKLIAIGLIALALALLWTTTLQPAWRLWTQSGDAHLAAQQQLAAMRALQVQAQALRQQPRMDNQQSRLAVTESVKAIGGQVSAQGANLMVELPAVSASDLAGWLAAVGPQMGARPVQATLQESGSGRWSARIMVELP